MGAGGAFSQILGTPQQAALQAHMNAAAQQESANLEWQLLQLFAAFSPLPTTTPQGLSSASHLAAIPTSILGNYCCRFQHIFYDPITQAQRLEKLSLPTMYPPKPPHVPDAVWHRALAQNPDPEEYIPVLVTSAEGLHSRLVAQQSKMELHEGYLSQLDKTLKNRLDFHRNIAVQLRHYQRQNVMIRSRLMQIMRKFEICRGKHVPIQKAETEAVQKLVALSRELVKAASMLEILQEDEEKYSKEWNEMKLKQERMYMQMRLDRNHRPIEERKLDPGVIEEAESILNGHKKGIEEMTRVVQKNARDVNIMKQDGRPVRQVGL